MEYEKIKQLMEDMENSRLTEMDIDFPDGTKIHMKKEEVKLVEKSELNEIKPKEKIENKTESSSAASIICSPMVGTFYIKPSPTSEPYVEVGSKIKKGQTVCIVEAMKLMNEIESDFDGEIAKICVKDGEAVEYGTPLFELK